ncbi:MAG: hypothetical protein VW644_03450 [Alphaproteobacteria bacterium]
MIRRLALAAALALLASPAAGGGDDGIDTDAMVNDAALVDTVYFQPETVHGIADALEEGNDNKRTMLQMAAAMQRTAHAPGEPFKVRLVERLREVDMPPGANQTAIWRVCRYPDRTCPVTSMIVLDETAYIADRPADFAEE